MERGQISVELIAVLAVILTIIIFIFNLNSEIIGYSQTSVDQTRINTLFDNLKNTANSVYNQGAGAKSRVYVVMPGNIQDITINPRSIVITANSGDTFFRNFDFNITGNLSLKGSYFVNVESKEGHVQFTR